MQVYLQNIKPVSTNHKARICGKRLIPTKSYLTFTKTFRQLIIAHRKTLEVFANGFNKGDLLSCHMVYEMPKKELYTKKSLVSKKSIDLDNVFKVTIDAVFKELAWYNPDIDDAFIMKISGEKKISRDDLYNIQFSLATI